MKAEETLTPIDWNEMIEHLDEDPEVNDWVASLAFPLTAPQLELLVELTYGPGGVADLRQLVKEGNVELDARIVRNAILAAAHDSVERSRLRHNAEIIHTGTEDQIEQVVEEAA